MSIWSIYWLFVAHKCYNLEKGIWNCLNCHLTASLSSVSMLLLYLLVRFSMPYADIKQACIPMLNTFIRMTPTAVKIC